MFTSFKWTKIAADRIAILKQYEPLQPYLLFELTDFANADIFIDVGANIGAYSILMSSLDCIESIHAFEPSPQTSEELAVNIGLNDCSHKVEIHRKALSDTAKNLRFGIVGSYSGANSVVESSIHAKDQFASEVNVVGAPLDSVLAYRERTISMKIDVEGHEKAVIAGAQKLLTANQGILQIESYDPDASSLAEILNKYNYRLIFHVGPDHYFTNMRLSDRNIVCVFEKAAVRLIKANFEPIVPRNATVKLPCGITVEVSSFLVNFARKLKTSLKRNLTSVQR